MNISEPISLPPANGKDPVLEATTRIESRIENLENMLEELIEKIHDMESNLRLFN